MDPQVQASFIPKKSLETSSREGSPFGLLFLVALLFFIASIVAAGGAFLYMQYLNTALASKTKSLALAEGAFDPGTIQELVRIDSRLTQSESLLSKHVAVSGVFNFLSQQTLEQVSFSSFDYTLGDDGTAKISLKGTANSFASVALQSDQFGGNKLLKNVVFSDITLDTSGKVGFSVAADLDASILSYNQSLSSGAAGAVVPVTPAANSASSTSQQGGSGATNTPNAFPTH